jgi:ketosteroid isomerase-like protein
MNTSATTGSGLVSGYPTTAELLDGDWTSAFSGQHAASLRVIAQWWSAIVAKDIDLITATMAEDMVIELPFDESGRSETFRRIEGKAQCAAFMGRAYELERQHLGAHNPELTMSVDGTVVFIEGLGDTAVKGRVYRNRYVFRFLCAGDKITHYRQYHNPIISAYAFRRQIAGKFEPESL